MRGLLKVIAEAIDAAGDDAKWLRRDRRLKDVRRRLYEWLICVSPGRQEDAAAYLVGALTLPKWLIPDWDKDVDEMASRRIRREHRIAIADLAKAAQALRKAADLIAKARSSTSIVPDVAVTTFHLFTRAIPASCRNRVPSTFRTEPDTVQILFDR
jgi:hypothetical protein